MRRIFTMTLLSLGLTGGVALADNHRGERVDHGRVERGERGNNRGERGGNRGERERFDRDEHVRDIRVRPAAHYEHHDDYRGFRWVNGEWVWNGYEWTWISGHYVRAWR